MPQHSNHRSPRKDKKKGHEKLFEEIIAENFPKMGKEIEHFLKPYTKIKPMRNYLRR